MRAICCSCGRLIAPNDQQLFRLCLNHTRDRHPNIRLTDLQLHTVLLYAACDFDPPGTGRSDRLMWEHDLGRNRGIDLCIDAGSIGDIAASARNRCNGSN
jgi:hypothetical protein